MLVTRHHQSQQRRGLILLVVLAMLTLFAITGIAFVIYANSQADASRIYREAANQTKADLSPEQALSFFLGQLIYDVPDDATGVNSAMRGHSFSRTMYGFHPSVVCDKPFAGTGRLHYSGPIGGVDDASLISYQYFQSDGFVRDPDYLGSRANPSAAMGSYVGQLNVPYTYPDLHNMAVAMVRASDGKVLMPSFHRPWLFGGSLAPSNPNWTSPSGKYLTLRPRPAEHLGLPFPDDDFGDVKNRPNAPGGNDSIWMDLGAPVMTAPDGRKYKALFAPLVIDLDGRVNLNVVANMSASGSAHASNQGWAASEINPAKLTANGALAVELRNALIGSGGSATPGTPARVYGRYGQGRAPAGGGVPAGTGARLWAGVDYDGTATPFGAATTRFLVPGEHLTNAPAYSGFPYFNPGYGNGIPGETTNHPTIFNPLRPAPGNGIFSPFSQAAILRFGGNSCDTQTSDLLRVFPQSLGGNTSEALMLRNLTTFVSCDLERPGLTPYIWDPTGAADATPKYGSTFTTFPSPSLNYPKADKIPFPALATLTGAPPAGSEFDATTRRGNLQQTLAALTPFAQAGKLDLNRPLTPYPPADATTGAMSDTAAAQSALTDRQNFARDIYNLLVKVTGCPLPGGVNTSNDYKANRFLAQLAVNIVDFIDQDDYSTPFNWTASDYVFGVELPRLVINEAYIQIDNDKADPLVMIDHASTFYNVSAWVELHNPLLDDSGNATYGGGTYASGATGRNDAKAILQNPGAATPALYRILIAKDSIGSIIGDPRNTRGDPDYDSPMTSRILKTMNDWTGTGGADKFFVKPIDRGYQDSALAASTNNTGFYTVGPSPTIYGTGLDPTMLPVKLASPNMTYTIAVGNLNYQGTEEGGGYKPWPTILLQRLACPGLPFNNTLGAALYNPYITVDYIENNNDKYVNEGRMNKNTGVVSPYDAMMNPTGRKVMTDRQAWGRNQPYAAAQNDTVRQAMSPNAPAAGQPLNTFYRHNAKEAAPPYAAAGNTLKTPFNWLIHLDRQLISPMELLHVSAARPDQLTQVFSLGAAPPVTSHLAPFLPDQDARLYRFLEVVQTKNRFRGIAQGGRVPGKININSVWNAEVLRAICDAQTGNRFYTDASGANPGDGQVNAVFNAVIADRSPTSDGSGGQMPGPSDRPFWSLSMGHATNTAGGDPMSPVGVAAEERGQRNTLLRTPVAGTPPPWFPFPVTTPIPWYQHTELITKIFNNLTTRSNTFAVWVTVGYFEVMNETTRPVRLGAEMGRAEGRHSRHRMFAIIDRTNLTAFQTNVTGSGITASPTPPNASPVYTTLPIAIPASGTNPLTNRPWSVVDGIVLVYEPDTDNEETVVVFSGNAKFTKSHPGGSTVICRGNPGPWTRYDPRQDPNVVLYWSVID